MGRAEPAPRAREFLRFWHDVDILVTPTSGILPPAVDWAPWDQAPDEHLATFMGFANLAQPFNLSGQPGVSVPAVWTDDGLPVGIQLVGRPFAEGVLLQVARQLEVGLPWADRRPSAFADRVRVTAVAGTAHATPQQR